MSDVTFRRWSRLLLRPCPAISSESSYMKVRVVIHSRAGGKLTCAIRRGLDQPGRPGRGDRALSRSLSCLSASIRVVRHVRLCWEVKRCRIEPIVFSPRPEVMCATLFCRRKRMFGCGSRMPKTPWMSWCGTRFALSPATAARTSLTRHVQIRLPRRSRDAAFGWRRRA